MTAYAREPHAPIFAALADPTRREIFERVAQRPQSVGELSAGLPVSRPAVSQHLRVLREAGLVSDRADGTRRIYRMDPQGIAHLRAYLDHFWNHALAAFKDAVERQPQQGGAPMSTQAAAAPVRTSIVVDAPIDRAFAAFTSEIGGWWPSDHHILRAELVEMVFEPRVGGHIYDRGVDGSECRWARVLAYDPPHRVAFSWDISLQWEREADPARCSEVEVTFVPESESRTRVELAHLHLERHGDGWERMRDAVSSPGGWDRGLRALAAYVAA